MLAGKGFYFNGMTHDSFIVDYQRKEDCLSHETYGEIIEMPWRADRLTVGECVAQIKSTLGAQAVIELEREIVRGFACQVCRTAQPVFKTISRLTEQDARCPGCGEIRWPDLTHTLDDSEAYAGMTLADMGIPPLDIITGRVGLHAHYFELSGDRAELLGWLAGSGSESAVILNSPKG